MAEQTAPDEKITLPRFYDLDGAPAYWEEGEWPKILSGGKWKVADIGRLTHQAEVITAAQFCKMLDGKASPVKKSMDGAPDDVLSAAGTVLAYHRKLRAQGQTTTERTSTRQEPRSSAASSAREERPGGSGTSAGDDLQLVTTMPEGEDDPDDQGEHEVWVSGRNGIKYPARYHPRSRRIRLIDHSGATITKSSGTWCEGWQVRNADRLRKAVAGNLLLKRHFSPEEMKALSLRWITVHPNGEDPGVPIIVHDDGQNYTVVGGAGGTMNQKVFRKDEAEKGAKKGNRETKNRKKAEAIAQVKEGDPESFSKLEAAEKGYRDAAKAATNEYRQKAEAILGSSTDDLLAKVAQEAERRAKKELGLDKKPVEQHTDEEKADIAEFVEEAKNKVETEQKAAVEAIINKALEATAKAQINQEAVNAEDVDAVKTIINGKQLVKKLSDDDIKQLVEGSARADALRMQANVIRRALKSGNAEAVQGIQAHLKPIEPTQAEQAEWAAKRYLNRESVITHTSLVQGSNLASERTQRAAQSNGAGDALNHYVSDLTGNAIMTPEVARRLGVENAARVAAAYLKSNGVDAKDLAGKLGQRIAEHSDADAMAALQQAAKLDEIARSAVEAARSGDGTVMHASARIIAGNMAAQKYRLLNNTRGRIRVASALADSLERSNDEPMVLPGGGTRLGAQLRAKEVGLAKSDYTIKQGKDGSYNLEVPADKVHTIADPHSIASAERATAMDAIKQENEENWREFSSPGMKIPLFKHGTLAVKAITGQKRVLLNYGAGSGKTGIIYGAISELLSGDKVDRVLVSMPAKPRSQQENYVDEEGKTQTGQKFKFLKDEMHDKVTVIKDGADFEKKKAKIASGELKAIIMSPELMRERVDDLEKLGFGGDRSAYFPDEAHRLSIGEGEGKGSGMAQAAARMSKSEYFAPGTGTSIENNASELYSLLNMVHPEEYPKGGMKAFRQEWERTAAQIGSGPDGGKTKLTGLFGNEAMAKLRNKLGGSMLSYHEPAKKKSGADVQFERHVHHVPLSEKQKDRIRSLNNQRDLEMRSEDPKVRKAAPLRWQAGVIRSVIGDEMFAEMAKKIDEGRLNDPAYRAVVWASEINPLLGGKNNRGLKGHFEKHGPTTQVTGANSDKQTAQALNEFNDRTNKNSALLVSNAGNFGINAQGGNAVFLAGHPLVYSNLDQLEHRVNRNGQEKDVQSHIFIGDHPIMKKLFHDVMEGKGKSARLLEVMAMDDSPVGGALAMHEKALRTAAGATAA